MRCAKKNLYTNENTCKNAASISNEIFDCLHNFGAPTENMFPLIPYLLYKVSQFSNPFDFTLQVIVGDNANFSEEVRHLAKHTLNDKLWEHLLHLTAKYKPEDFALAALTPFSNSEQKGVISTPDSVIRLAHKLLDVRPGEAVADVCCGSGTYITSAALEENYAIYHGYEINETRHASALMKADLLDADIEIKLCDIFSIVESKKVPKYDKIFANYPFGLKLKDLGGGIDYLEKMSVQYPGLSKATSSDWVFNSVLCDILSENGKAIGIMTNGSTLNSIDIPMRKHFVESKMVECVISLPGKLFANTSIPTTLIVLSHNNDYVRMIDATKHCQQGRRQNVFTDENIETILNALTTDSDYSKSISIDELRKNDYNLSLSQYVNNNVAFQNGVLFESIIKSISRGAPCTASQLDAMVSDAVTNMQYLMIANIQNGMIDDKLPYLSYIDPKYEKYCLKNNTLILSKNGYPYKVAVASVQNDQRILANGNLYIIELDENKANPYYIKAFLDSAQGHSALKNITVGASIPNIGVDKLKKIEIPLPSMIEQERIAQKYQEALEEIAVIKSRLETAINKLNHIFDEESN